MFKKLFIINFFFLIFTLCYAEEQKIVYLNIEKIMQNSIAGKSIKKQLENLYNKDLEKFKKNDEILKNKEKKLITQKNILSQEDFQKELTNLRSEIINFQKEQMRARENINKLRIEATSKLISKLSPILQEYAKKNSISLILQKKNIIMGKKEIEITEEILSITNNEIKDIKIN
ncbi:OmpH family outer membrane protein [Candidatus Pelagibacter communis]|uniref:OmpH family outer membrane protein n=1 Tax=Pelagibacter ubique TaxID=198252 RepID=UPI0009E35C14|nr:OmpH family outer membrane protein [Candidatus Pelagibacter ubique]